MRNQRNIVRLINLTLAPAIYFFLNALLAPQLGQSVHAMTTSVAKADVQSSARALANGKIAFTSDRDGNPEIYVMNPDGTNQLRLTNNPGVDDHATFSPDGTKIAFVSQNASGGFALKLMNVDGSNQIELTAIDFDNSPYHWHDKWSLSWSPDGRKIAFQERGEIFTINIDGSNRTNITNHPAQDMEPSWSPDGSRIAFTSSRVSYFTIHTMNADGSDVKALPREGDFWDMSPSWSPTGNKIAFIVHSEVHLPEIYLANADGSNRQLFDGCNAGLCSEHPNRPTWSPDGIKILFHKWEYFSNDAEIYVKDIYGPGYAQLTNTVGKNFNPSWQPLAPASCSSPNPIDCADFFVLQHYRDFLNREPDPEGLAFWTNEITSCGGNQACIEVKRINDSGSFFLSVEFQQTGYLVYRMYKAAYSNLPDTPVPIKFSEFLPDTQKIGHGVVVGQTGWQAALESNKQAFSDEFVSRPRFTSTYPQSMTSADFVNLLNANVGSPLSQTELDHLVSDLTTGAKTRAQVLRAVAENQSFRDAEFNRAFVLMQYFGYLRRDPNSGPDTDFSGYDFWLNKLNSFNGNFVSAEMVKAFITSTEYRQRFGP